MEEAVLLGPEGTDLVRDIVGDNNELAAPRILRRAGVDQPANHAARVGSRLARDLGQVVVVVKNKLVVVDALSDGGLFVGKGRVLLNRLGPAVLDGLAEQLGEVIHVLGTHKVGLIPLGLEPVLGRVRGRDREQMHGSNLGGAADGVEYPVTLLRLALGVHLNLDDVARRVGDDNTQRVRHARGRVRADDADLHLGNTETPATGPKAVEEALQRVLNLLRLELEHGREVDEHVVQVRVVVADDLQRVEDVVDDAVRLGDQVLGCGDLVPQTSRTDNSAGEVALVRVDALADGLVHVDVLVLGKHRLDLEVRETSELELESKSRLGVTDAVVLDVLGSSEGVVSGVGPITATSNECETADTTSCEISTETFDNREDLGKQFLVSPALGVADRDIDDSRELVKRLGTCRRSRTPLAVQIGNQTRFLRQLVASNRKAIQGTTQRLLCVVEISARNYHTLAGGLLRHVA